MAHHSSFDDTGLGVAPAIAQPLPSAPLLSFPAEAGDPLAEAAERDLEATLQLLVNRARYLTGASGGAIAILEGEQLVCRASEGPSAPPAGTELVENSALLGECLRTRQVLNCGNIETDPRVTREYCRALEIRSLMVVPLVWDEGVLGIVELTAGRLAGFEEQDVLTLTRLSEMIVTALQHADAAKRVHTEIHTRTAELTPAETVSNSETQRKAPLSVPVDISSPAAAELPRIRACQGCGFPVSEGRSLCLDCEEAGFSSADPAGTPAFLAKMARDAEQGWLQSHSYTIGTFLMVVLTVALLAWKLS